MPIPQKTPSRVVRTALAKAVLAVSGAALAAGALLAFPATAAAASKPANLLIRPSRPFPSFSFPVPPTTQFPTPGSSTIIPVGVKKSAAPKHSDQGQFSYVSTFSPAPVAASTPANTASASCVASSSTPAPGPGGDLDLPGINGTSKDIGHVGALPINSLGPTAMLPPQIDSTNLGQLKVTRPVDATSTNLSMVASSGYRFPCVHIEIGPGRGYGNAEYALVNAGLVADDRSGSTETLTWTYSTILWSYTVPGSPTVHQGSGQINAQPDRTTSSLVTDSKAVAAGTIGLTVVVSLGLIALYIVGRRRNRARYRERYYRRAAARAQRELLAAGALPVMQSAEPVQPAEIWEPRAGEVGGEVAGEVVEVAGPGESAEAPETAELAEAVAPETEAETAPVVEAVPEPEAAEAEAAEPEAAKAEAAKGSDAVTEPEVADESEPESESESEEPAEAESTESHVAEAEPDPEQVENAEEPAESEAIVQSDETVEPEEPGQSGETAEPEEPVQPDETAEPEEVVQSDETVQANGTVQSGETDESNAEASASEAEPAPGDEHEPAAAR